MGQPRACVEVKWAEGHPYCNLSACCQWSKKKEYVHFYLAHQIGCIKLQIYCSQALDIAY